MLNNSVLHREVSLKTPHTSSANTSQTNVLFQRILDYCTLHKLIKEGDTILIGLSGGPDSILLAHFLAWLQKKMNCTVIAAHLDHGWRQDSHKDMLFTKRIAEALGFPFINKHANKIIGPAKRGSLEEYGRELRRAFFEQVAASHNAQKIALGHHQDDQIETFFIRLLRGAGLHGLASIRPQQGAYIHPLLGITKQEIIAYLDNHQIQYLTDYTNVADTHLRNRIRMNVIPVLKQTDKRFEKNCIRAINNLQHADAFVEKEAQKLLASLSEVYREKRVLALEPFRSLSPFMQKEVLLAWLIDERVAFVPTTGFFDEIIRFLSSTTGGFHELGPSWGIRQQQQHAWIEKPKPE